MVTAVALIRSETDQVPELAAYTRRARGRERGVLRRRAVRPGRACAVRENDDLARVISEKMRKLPGIKSSETLIAFKVYSKQDIEAAFRWGSTSGCSRRDFVTGLAAGGRSSAPVAGRGPRGRLGAWDSPSSTAARSSST